MIADILVVKIGNWESVGGVECGRSKTDVDTPVRKDGDWVGRRCVIKFKRGPSIE
jgi:hypothetical protein